MQKQTELNLNNDEIYYGKEACWRFMGVSQYKDFKRCEAQALAKLKGEYEQGNITALLVGNYVHSYFEGPEAHRDFLAENNDKLYKKNGELYRDYLVADKMIERLGREKLFNFLWQGQHEQVVTGELFGAQWKGKIDLLNIEKGYFIDLKTSADLKKRFWNLEYGGWTSFVHEYGYGLQMAVYERLLEQQYGKKFTGYIFAVTKQDVPDVAAIEIPEQLKAYELEMLSKNLERVEAVKNGQEKPEMCGSCEYCREHKELTGFVSADELI